MSAPHVCSFVPPHILNTIANHADVEEAARIGAQNALDTLACIQDIRRANIQKHAGRRLSRGWQQVQDVVTSPSDHYANAPSDVHDDDDPHSAHGHNAAGHQCGSARGHQWHHHHHDIRQDKTATGTDPVAPAAQKASDAVTAATTGLNRKIYTCDTGTFLPGRLVRSEGSRRVTDRGVNFAYDTLGITHDFYKTCFGRNSIDDKGLTLVGSVHFDMEYSNAYWDGSQMVFGDGDAIIFTELWRTLDVAAHELTHAVTQYSANLDYEGQSGALNESVSDCFGVMAEQWYRGQTVDCADWLIGEGILPPALKGSALRSMAAPGTAYNDPILGKDPQPDHMSKFLNTTKDNGGVHINSGIPNKAFYNACMSLGGNSWERAGKIWYDTLTGGKLSRDATFKQFADATVRSATILFGDAVATMVHKGWADVGVY